MNEVFVVETMFTDNGADGCGSFVFSTEEKAKKVFDALVEQKKIEYASIYNEACLDIYLSTGPTVTQPMLIINGYTKHDDGSTFIDRCYVKMYKQELDVVTPDNVSEYDLRRE